MAVRVGPQTETRKMAYADYAAMPDDGHRYQVIDGELIMTPAPSASHQGFLLNLVRLIDAHVRAAGLGKIYFAPFDVVLSNENVVQPDLLFISKERLSIITDANVQGAPDLVVEVLSPGTAQLDKTPKRDLYARFGVREYWLVSPEAGTIEVLVLRADLFERSGLFGSGDEVKSNILSGLSFRTNAVFED
ncbi:MAG TPA: Uma2 family endonuclease [Anaerolineae bacterium]|nr:Uma2 family endonuclease [Anaerolineae bacterium]